MIPEVDGSEVRVVGTEVIHDPRLDRTVVVAQGVEEALALDPKSIFCDASLLVIDGIDWRADFEPMRKSQSIRRRNFEDPFNDGPPSEEAAAQIAVLVEQANEIYGELYGWATSDDVALPRRPKFNYDTGWRNQPSGPEPMHFDTYDPGGCAVVLGMINFDAKVRKYNIGWRTKDLVREHHYLMRQIVNQGQNFSVSMRSRWKQNKAPFDEGFPSHEVAFSPKSIWFFHPKLILHQLVWGRGVIPISWNTVGSGALLQSDVLAEL